VKNAIFGSEAGNCAGLSNFYCMLSENVCQNYYQNAAVLAGVTTAKKYRGSFLRQCGELLMH